MPRFNRRSRLQRKRANKTPGPLANSRMGPPQFKSNILYRHQFRFVSTSSATTGIPPRTLIQATGIVAATAILGYSFVSSIRIDRISIWAPPASQGAAATCSVLWYGNASNFSQVEISDTTMSTAQPAHVVCAPPLNSFASFWQNDSTATLMTLSVPVGGVIDIWVSMILGDGALTVQPSPLVLVGATPGSTYYEPLDGRGGVYTPVSLTAN